MKGTVALEGFLDKNSNNFDIIAYISRKINILFYSILFEIVDLGDNSPYPLFCKSIIQYSRLEESMATDIGSRFVFNSTVLQLGNTVDERSRW